MCNRMRALLLAVLLSISGSQAAFAQDAATPQGLQQQILSKLVGTISVKAHPIFSEGRLSGCELEYNAITRDYAYRQGAFIRVSGSIALLSTSTNPVATLKVLLSDFEPRTMAFTSFIPASAYYIDGNTTTKGAILASTPSDTGGLFIVFRVTPTYETIARGLGEGRVTIAFARTKGGLDIVVPIETFVVNTTDDGERSRSKKMAKDFLDCGETILKQFIARHQR